LSVFFHLLKTVLTKKILKNPNLTVKVWKSKTLLEKDKQSWQYSDPKVLLLVEGTEV